MEPRLCVKCRTELEEDEEETCTRCQFYELIDEFERVNIS